MNNKICWIDTETTGFSAEKNDVIQVAIIIDIDREIVATYDFKCRPLNPENAHPVALQITGLTLPEIMEYPEPRGIITQIETALLAHLEAGEQYFFGAHNCPFDRRMMGGLYTKNGVAEDSFTDLFMVKEFDIDTQKMIKQYNRTAGSLALADAKLVTAAQAFCIDHNPHEASSDINATRELYYALLDD